MRGISRTVLAQDLAATITEGNCKGHGSDWTTWETAHAAALTPEQRTAAAAPALRFCATCPVVNECAQLAQLAELTAYTGLAANTAYRNGDPRPKQHQHQPATIRRPPRSTSTRRRSGATPPN